MVKAFAVASALLLAVGCGTGGATSAAKTATAAPPPPDGGSFDTPASIITKAGSALPCTDASPLTPTGAKAQSMCQDGNIVIRIYEDHSGIDDQIKTLGSAGGAWLLTGENWSVNAPESMVDALKAKLGGQVVHVKCRSFCS